MIIPLRYADGYYDLNLPESALGEVLTPLAYPPLDLDKTLEGLCFPQDLHESNRRLLIVINDAFRCTPTDQILDRIIPRFKALERIRIIVATGLHPKPTHEEYRRLIGRHYPAFEQRVSYSDCRDRGSFELLGRWSDGAEVYIHRWFGWADKVLVIGSVEPHYFAGFTGGIKSLIPGLSFQTTISHNHQMAISPLSQPCQTRGNPVWEQLWETLKFIPPNKVYSLQMVCNHNRAISGLFFGSLEESHQQATELSRQIYLREIDHPYDLVVAEHTPPLDRNLYQLQKCFENSKEAVRDGGTLIILSACREGIGTPAFYDLADKYPSPDSILAREHPGYDPGVHKLYRTALLTKRINLCLMSDLPDEVVRKVYLKPVGHANEVIGGLLATDPDKKILVVKDAGHVVIRLKQNKGG